MLQTGSIVQLKSGGQPMTVKYTDVLYSSHTKKDVYQKDGVECVWHNSAGEKVSAVFLPGCLVEVAKKKGS